MGKRFLGYLVMAGWLLLLLLLFMPATTFADKYDDIPTHCVDNCGSNNDNSNSSTRQENRERRRAQEDEEIDRKNANIQKYNAIIDQRNKAYDRGDYSEVLRLLYEMQKLIDGPNVRKGIADLEKHFLAEDYDRQAGAADVKGDYKQALELYKKALATFSDPSQEYRKYVADYEQKVARQDKIAKTFDHLADSLKHDRPAPSTPGLEFGGSETKEGVPNNTSGLEFMPVSNTASGTHIFGTTSNPPNPDLGSSATAPAIKVNSTLEQLSSIDKSSQDAKNASAIEDAKNLASCGFDKAPCRTPDTINFPKSLGQTPGAMELSSHIPEAAKKDPKIQNSIAWFDRLEMLKAETQIKISDIQKQIKKGDGDPTILSAHLGTLENQMSQYNKDQDDTKKIIDKRLIDLTLEWKEDLSTDEVKPKGESK